VVICPNYLQGQRNDKARLCLSGAGFAGSRLVDLVVSIHGLSP
jgi:hypothetical protein